MSLPPNVALRRRALTAAVGAPILLANNGNRARNLPMNVLPFRADSTFLYFTGCAEPGAFALLLGDTCTLFLTPPEPDDALWHGEVDTLEARRVQHQVDAVRPLAELDAACARHKGRLMGLAVPDLGATQRLSQLIGRPLSYASAHGAEVLVDAVIALRRCRDAWELDQMRLAADHARAGHVAAMGAARVGGHEREVAALFEAVLAARGVTTSYPSIVTVRGEVLHNFAHPNPLRDGDLLLLDGGAEVDTGYASDVTRTWPVNGRFSSRQRDVYAVVLAANEAGIAACRAGARFADLHWAATRMLAEGLRDLGLVSGPVDSLVESGAVGSFFPHGLGHLLGLDVHDLENFGDRPAYGPGRSRPTQFGARNLRMDLDLEPGMVVTIEPGIYFVPAILHDAALRARFRDQVNFAAAESWLGFGGVRIEDDVAVRAPQDADGAPEVLSARVPKSLDALEALVGRGLSAAERLSA